MRENGSGFLTYIMKPMKLPSNAESLRKNRLSKNLVTWLKQALTKMNPNIHAIRWHFSHPNKLIFDIEIDKATGKHTVTRGIRDQLRKWQNNWAIEGGWYRTG